MAVNINTLIIENMELGETPKVYHTVTFDPSPCELVNPSEAIRQVEHGQPIGELPELIQTRPVPVEPEPVEPEPETPPPIGGGTTYFWFNPDIGLTLTSDYIITEDKTFYTWTPAVGQEIY